MARLSRFRAHGDDRVVGIPLILADSRVERAAKALRGRKSRSGELAEGLPGHRVERAGNLVDGEHVQTLEDRLEVFPVLLVRLAPSRL